MSRRACPSCGYEAERADGTTHAYLAVSPECWALFNESMALHYSDVAFWRSHQLLVDAYSLQHSAGDDRRSVQSAALHLAALVYHMDHPDAPEAAVVRLRKGLAERDSFPAFDPYPEASVTIASVTTADAGAHWETTCAYAGTVCEDWRDHHGTARAMIAEVMG